MRMRSSNRRLSGALILAIASLGVATPLLADPPPQPPTCGLELDPLFCIRVTDHTEDPLIDGRDYYEFEFVNWTSTDASGLNLYLNTGGEQGSPTFQAGGAYVDADGRPMVGDPSPPRGNPPKTNDWTPTSSTPTFISFSAGSVIPHRQANVNGLLYDGLLDPDLNNVDLPTCEAAELAMIPGSVLVNRPPDKPLIHVPDVETIDDQDNWLDGFVIAFDGWDCGEEVSVNWLLLGPDFQPIGQITQDGDAIDGDQYGFGTWNLVKMCPQGPNGPQVIQAPPPMWTINHMDPTRINKQYDPRDTSDPNQDSPNLWAEDTDGSGQDQYRINPIPGGKPGAGKWGAIEPGAAVTAPFVRAEDDEFNQGTILERAPLGRFCLKWTVFCDGVQVDSISGSNITGTWYHYDCANNQPGMKGKIAAGMVTDSCGGANGNAIIVCRVSDGCTGLGADYGFVLDSLDGTLDMFSGSYPGSCWIDELGYNKLTGACTGGPQAGPTVSSVQIRD